jgi:tetratricopeptide (TPR) repeat protein
MLMQRHAARFRIPAFPRRTLTTLLLLLALRAFADDLNDARKLFLTGKYQPCLTACEKVAKDDDHVEEWRLLEAQTLLTLGRYPEAENVTSNALARTAGSIQLRLLGFDTANGIGNTTLARTRLREINQLAANRTWAYRDPPNIVALGQAALLLGADPKTVLERLFNPAQMARPDLREAWLANGELALDKNDFALAAKTFTEAIKKFPEDADMLNGLARAYQPNARGKMLELTDTALEKNENHVPSMLLLTDHLVDAEEYAEADKMLDRALKVNPWQPEAWAYRAVLAHLRNDPAGETAARKNGLKYWKNNPAVDHLIGLKLSQKYRFVEGATCQQKALGFDPGYLPAQIQLAEDLLRLGEETAGWQLAEQVHKQDAYDVTAYNLVTLRGTMQKFQTLTNADFILRMSQSEAALYGDRALALLGRAKAKLTEKYGVTLDSPTFVEIFPEQKDFGVRTFGMPGNPGFLGVCFGRVVTANSPASQGGNPANWEAVLWHEFCHVVTLQMTKNKMPRWLSEGISVYEELQANPTWGQTMNPRYREMVLGDDLTPVSELSGAFMSPKSDLHVQFAYYESALVVEYLVSKYGFESLKAILHDLGNGVDINDGIAKHTAPMKQIEKEFAAFAKAKAEALGPELDWEKPEGESGFLRRLGLSGASLSRRADKEAKDEIVPPLPKPPLPKKLLTNDLHDVSPPKPAAPAPATKPAAVATKSSNKANYWTLLEQATKSVSEKKWQAAKAPLNKLIELYPNQSGPNNAYAMLATVHRNLNETPEEHAALENWAAQEADALDAYQRLMELAEKSNDWKTVPQNAERFLAVNPLLPQPYRFLATASEALGENQSAIGAYQKLLLLDPADPADVHFRVARLMRVNNDPAAKRHVLQALEEAPRFRDAHRLLLQLAQATSETNANSTNVLPKVEPANVP